jgi:hypothetical protein
LLRPSCRPHIADDRIIRLAALKSAPRMIPATRTRPCEAAARPSLAPDATRKNVRTRLTIVFLRNHREVLKEWTISATHPFTINGLQIIIPT